MCLMKVEVNVRHILWFFFTRITIQLCRLDIHNLYRIKEVVWQHGKCMGFQKSHLMDQTSALPLRAVVPWGSKQFNSLSFIFCFLSSKWEDDTFQSYCCY